MDYLLGGVAGMVSGAAGAFVAGVVQLVAKRLRNRRLVRRGEPPIRDVVYDPFWVLFAIVGFLAGLSWSWRLEGAWLSGAVAGLGAPALATLIFTGWGLAQLRR